MSENSSCLDESISNSSSKESQIVNSITSDDLYKRKRVMVRLPDGTYAHGKNISDHLNIAYKTGLNDSWMEVKQNNHIRTNP